MGEKYFAQNTTIRIEHLSIRWGACWDNRTNIHWNARRGEIFFAQNTTIRIEHFSIRWGVRWDNRWTYIGTHVGRNIFRPYNDHNPKFAQYHTHGWA